MHKKVFLGVFFVSFLFVAIASAQEANRIYAITFSYQKNTNTLSLTEIREAIGSIDESSAGASYRLDVLSSDDDVLHSLYFNIEEQRGNPDIVKFSVFVPYYDEANHINVYDKDNNQILSVLLQDAINTKSGFGQLSPLSQGQQVTKSGSETPLLAEDKKFNFNPKWLYIASPIVLIIGFLFIVEWRRKSDHAQLMSRYHGQKSDNLRNYVATNLRKGYKKEQIRNALIKNNYSNKEIEEAFRGIRFIK